MIEVKGNLWTFPADIRVITTNGTLKKNGEAVMGRGCALEATVRYDGIARVLGNSIRNHGNHVAFIYGSVEGIYSFPVKHDWWDMADLALIERSAGELVKLMDALPTNAASLLQHTRVVMPRPGCGNGRLKWADVKPILEPILNDRFHVITFEAKP